MKTITLFRHAKSDWKDSPVIADFDRPLTARGIKAAPLMGKTMKQYGLKPDLILCSPSARTRETLSRAQSEIFDDLPKILFLDALYHAEAQTMIDLARTLPEEVRHVMIVGHNPGLQDLAIRFASDNIQASEFSLKFPTAAVASFSFNIQAWGELKEKAGKLSVFLTPKTI